MNLYHWPNIYSISGWLNGDLIIMALNGPDARRIAQQEGKERMHGTFERGA